MPIYLGSNKVKDLYLGTSKIKEIYLGTSKVYSSETWPEGYTRYDFLRFGSGSAGAYVDVGLTFASYFRTVMTLVMLTNSTINKAVFGFTSGGATRRYIYYSKSSGAFLTFLPSSIGTISAAVDTSVTLDITANPTAGTISITDGTTSISGTLGASTNAAYIGTNNSTAYTGPHKVYETKVYDANGKLIRDLVPAMQQNASGQDTTNGFVNLAYSASDADTGAQFYAANNQAQVVAGND